MDSFTKNISIGKDDQVLFKCTRIVDENNNDNVSVELNVYDGDEWKTHVRIKGMVLFYSSQKPVEIILEDIVSHTRSFITISSENENHMEHIKNTMKNALLSDKDETTQVYDSWRDDGYNIDDPERKCKVISLEKK